MSASSLDSEKPIFAKPPLPGRHPLIAVLSNLMLRANVQGAWLCERAGLCEGSITRWRRQRSVPNLAAFDAALNALGYELTVRRRLTRPEE